MTRTMQSWCNNTSSLLYLTKYIEWIVNYFKEFVGDSPNVASHANVKIGAAYGHENSHYAPRIVDWQISQTYISYLSWLGIWKFQNSSQITVNKWIKEIV
mgnify:CR=1 FL=1